MFVVHSQTYAIYPKCNCDAALRGWKASRGRANGNKTQAKKTKRKVRRRLAVVKNHLHESFPRLWRGRLSWHVLTAALAHPDKVLPPARFVRCLLSGALIVVVVSASSVKRATSACLSCSGRPAAIVAFERQTLSMRCSAKEKHFTSWCWNPASACAFNGCPASPLSLAHLCAGPPCPLVWDCPRKERRSIVVTAHRIQILCSV